MIGKTLAHYEITDLLGKGGMGEVYRALDQKLGREVALKILPAAWSQDPERLARFDREARTLATLQHPNVASAYGFETTSEARFLVMELVEGEGLDQRMARGPIPVDQARKIAVQIASGLDAAHEKGIVHRDLKPANIRISTDGSVKVLDFGLAKAWAGGDSDADLLNSPTMTAHATIQGVILGTAGYMSPEQARGQDVDKRTDIWAFGVILWEMLTGRRLFDGNTVSDVMAGVLRAEINQSALPTETPPAMRRLLKRCLEREVKLRLRDIGDAALELDETGDDGLSQATVPGGTGFPAPPRMAGPSRFRRPGFGVHNLDGHPPNRRRDCGPAVGPVRTAHLRPARHLQRPFSSRRSGPGPQRGVFRQHLRTASSFGYGQGPPPDRAPRGPTSCPCPRLASWPFWSTQNISIIAYSAAPWPA